LTPYAIRRVNGRIVHRKELESIKRRYSATRPGRRMVGLGRREEKKNAQKVRMWEDGGKSARQKEPENAEPRGHASKPIREGIAKVENLKETREVRVRK